MSTLTITETLSAPPTAYGKVRYIPAGQSPQPSSQPYGLPTLSEFCDERQLPLHDLRPLATLDDLSTAKDGSALPSPSGFTAVQHPSIMHSPPYTDASWRDPEILKEVYVPETQDLLKRVTGAKTVIVEAMVLRDSSQPLQEGVPTDKPDHEQNGSTKKEAHPPFSSPKQSTAKLGFPLTVGFSPAVGARPPVPKAHVDYAAVGARTHIRLSHPAVATACAPIIAEEDRLQAAGLPLDTHYSSSPAAPRWAAYSVWRPLKTVKRDPLAVGDMRSFQEEDLGIIGVPVPTMDPEGAVKEMHTVNSYVGIGREGHRWSYVSEQKRDEVLIVGHWDSGMEGNVVGAGGVMHSSVELEGQEKEEPRESLELRCLAIW